MDTKQRLIELAQGIQVERDVLRVAEKVREYDSNLFLQYCDPDKSDINDAPYRLMEHCTDGLDRVVFYIWELDDRVIERVRNCDTQKKNVILDVHGKNLLAKQQSIRRYQDRKEQEADIIRHILASPKGEYTIPTSDGGIARVSDTRPVERISNGKQ